MNQLLCIDIGTTEIKFRVYSKVHTLHRLNMPIETYIEGASVYQSPEDILSLVLNGAETCFKLYPDIKKIAFSTAMHSLIPYTEESQLKMYIWSDSQASEVIEAFKQTEQAKEFYERTGTPIHPMTPFAKILYFKLSQPDYFKEIIFWQDIKSYLIWRLTGEYVLDYSLASATGIYNTVNFEWDPQILDYLSINSEQLPDVLDGKTEYLLKKELHQMVGNKTDVKIVLGGSDGCLASLASFAKTDSNVSLTIGTSGAVRRISQRREVDYGSQQFCYYLNDSHWVIGGATNNGGKVLQWLQSSLLDNKVDVFDTLPQLLNKNDYNEKTSPLIFLPYIQGERSPIWNSQAKGSFCNLSIEHTLDQLILSVVEGIVFNMKVIFENCLLGSEQSAIVLNGGVFKIDGMAQLVADVFQQVVIIGEEYEPSDGLLELYGKSEALEYSTQKKVHPRRETAHYYEERFCMFRERIVSDIKI